MIIFCQCDLCLTTNGDGSKSFFNRSRLFQPVYWYSKKITVQNPPQTQQKLQIITNFFSSIRYHGSSSSIKCHVYHHVGGRRHTPVVCNESRGPHTSHYTSRPFTKKKQPTDYSNQPLCSRPVEIF